MTYVLGIGIFEIRLDEHFVDKLICIMKFILSTMTKIPRTSRRYWYAYQRWEITIASAQLLCCPYGLGSIATYSALHLISLVGVLAHSTIDPSAFRLFYFLIFVRVSGHRYNIPTPSCPVRMVYSHHSGISRTSMHRIGIWLCRIKFYGIATLSLTRSSFLRSFVHLIAIMSIRGVLFLPVIEFPRLGMVLEHLST